MLKPKPKKAKKPKSRKARAIPHSWHDQFLSIYRSTGNVRLSCEKAGISRLTYYAAKKKNAEFMVRCEEAKEDAIETLEAIARSRAMSTSDTLMIFLLKSLRPEVYRDRYQHEISGPDGQAIPLEVQVSFIKKK